MTLSPSAMTCLVDENNIINNRQIIAPRYLVFMAVMKPETVHFTFLLFVLVVCR
jgi:hypothetical protein